MGEFFFSKGNSLLISTFNKKKFGIIIFLKKAPFYLQV